MVDDLVARVEANPKYQKLVSARSSYSIFMTSLVMLVYFGFILLIAFDKELLATKLGPDMVTSLGIPLGIGVIVITIILTNIYLRRANSEFDRLNADIIKEAKRK